MSILCTRSELISKPKVAFETMIVSENRELCTPEAIAFLKEMLCYDFNERITAKEALAHPFFNSVKMKV